MTKWIPLPIEFRGIWINQCYGAFYVSLSDRFKRRRPPDRMLPLLKQADKHLKLPPRKPHEYAAPTWIPRRELEETYGKIEKVLVNEEMWKYDNSFSRPSEDEILIYTREYVITVRDYDGFEYFIGLPRNPPCEK